MKLIIWTVIALLCAGCSSPANLDPANEFSSVTPAVKIPNPGNRVDLSKVLVKGKTNILSFHAPW